MEEYIERLQAIVKELKRRNYYLEQKDRVLKELIRDYQDWNRILKGFILIVFMLKQLIVRLYLLDLFDGNNACVIIF